MFKILLLVILFRREFLSSNDDYQLTLVFNRAFHATSYILIGSNVEILCGEDHNYIGDIQYFLNDDYIDINVSNIYILNNSLIIKNISLENGGIYSCKSEILSPLLPNSSKFYTKSIPRILMPIENDLILKIDGINIEPSFNGVSRLKIESNISKIPDNYLTFIWETSVYLPQISILNIDHMNISEQSVVVILTQTIVHIYWIRFPFLVYVNTKYPRNTEAHKIKISPIIQDNLDDYIPLNDNFFIIYPQPDLVLYEGDTTTLECLTNITPANITWLHDGEPILYNSNKVKVFLTALILKYITKPDSGKYTCVVSSGIEKITSSSYLDVEEKNITNSDINDDDLNLTNIEISNSTIKIGESFVFKIQKPEFCTYKVLKNGDIFNSSIFNPNLSASFLIVNATNDDIGLYQLIIYCGKSVISYFIPLLVEENYGTDESMLKIFKIEKNRYTIEWKIPYFISILYLFQCLEIKSTFDFFQKSNCFNSSINLMTVDTSLPYNSTFFISLSTIDRNYATRIISSTVYQTDIAPFNISQTDFEIYDLTWKIIKNKWILNWQLNTLQNIKYLEYFISCIKFNGIILSNGQSFHNNFTCGDIGAGVNAVEVFINFNGKNVSSTVFKIKYKIPNSLAIHWVVHNNAIDIVFINDRNNFIDKNLPIIFILQQFQCIISCNITSQFTYHTLNKMYKISGLNYSSHYQLYYMRSDIEDLSKNPYIFFYTQKETVLENNGLWMFWFSLFLTIAFILLFILLYVFIFSKIVNPSQNNEFLSVDDHNDYIFNVDFLPLEKANFDNTIPSARLPENKECGILVNLHNERCILKILTNQPNMSFKTKLLQRCEYNKCSVPEYITKKSRYGYSSLVSTNEIRINSHDYYSSAIEAEQSAARKALIELNDISRDFNLLLPEYIFRMLLPNNELFFSYRNTLHILCIDLGCDLPEYKVRLTRSGCECQVYYFHL